MNEQKVKTEWKKFEDGIAAYIRRVRVMGGTVREDADNPSFMKAMLKDQLPNAKSALDSCINAIDAILNEI